MPEILVIDDDAFILDVLERHLLNAGYSVRCAADPVVGIKAVLEARPDLILLDVSMPYMSGLEVLQALKGDPESSDIPVIMLTSHTDDETWLAALQAGAAAYITKPFEKNELIETLQKWVKA